MRKTMNVWVLIGISACVLAVFFWYSGSLSKTVAELNDTYEASAQRLSNLKDERAELKATLDTVGTDAFIENQARTLYGYMMPDELHLIITNKEALYGDDEIPLE